MDLLNTPQNTTTNMFLQAILKQLVEINSKLEEKKVVSDEVRIPRKNNRQRKSD